MSEGFPIFPTINASLNALAGICLGLGWRCIRKGDRQAHKQWMLRALGCSVVFLVSYVTYHALKAGAVTRYPGTGLDRTIYLVILITHTPLAALVVPLSVAAVVAALKGRIETHRKIVRWLFPAWCYVSVTGVIIYAVLYGPKIWGQSSY